MDTFGSRLREARVAKKLSQKALAAELNTTASSVSRWEKNQAEPSFKDLARLAELLEVGIDWLVLGKEARGVSIELPRGESRLVFEVKIKP